LIFVDELVEFVTLYDRVAMQIRSSYDAGTDYVRMRLNMLEKLVNMMHSYHLEE